jgi:hypothetical protein
MIQRTTCADLMQTKASGSSRLSAARGRVSSVWLHEGSMAQSWVVGDAEVDDQSRAG